MKYRIITLVCACLFFTGCQIIEEGEVDYVRTIENSSLNAKDLSRCNKELYDTSELTRAGVTRECYETLYRKYTRVPQIKSGETISVHLMQAFNGVAFEWKNASEFFGRKGSNAEIVIIANVCEQGKAGCSMSFGPSSDRNGRVIFYSNGVKALQYLNFSYLPVYGPIKYEGGPLIIQLTIVELDDPSDQQKAMLKTLASAGQQLYPPASEVLTVLDSVGSAILANSTDDILFRYSMTLVPDSNSHNYQSPIVAEGNYAFIRKSTNKGPLEQEVFDDLMFDNLSGRLVQECSEKENKKTINNHDDGTSDTFDYIPCTLDLNTGKMFKDYRKNTYLTFQIKSGFVEKTLDNIQTFEMLLNDINQATDENTSQAIAAISDLQATFISNSVENNLLKSLNEAKSIARNIPNDQFDLFSVQTSELINLYQLEVGKLANNNCYLSNATAQCKQLISEKKLTSFQLDFRSFLKSLNPTSNTAISTMIPMGAQSLQTESSLQTAFENGYKVFFNSAVYESFMANFKVINNLSENIKQLKGKDDNSYAKYISHRAKLLNEEISQFLTRLSYDHALSTSLQCSAVTSQSCYLYLTNSDKKKVLTAFNEYLKSNNIESLTLDSTNNSSLTNSLLPTNTSKILKEISNKF